MNGLRFIQEFQDHAAVLDAIGRLTETVSGVKERAFLAAKISEQISSLEAVHAQENQDLQNRLVDLYLNRVARLKEDKGLIGFLTFGFFGGRTWEECTEFARKEISALMQEFRMAQSGQVAHAIAARMPLLEFTLGSREGAMNLAENLLRTLAPSEYNMIKGLCSDSRGGAAEEVIIDQEVER